MRVFEGNLLSMFDAVLDRSVEWYGVLGTAHQLSVFQNLC
jgi:hypothetical protein